MNVEMKIRTNNKGELEPMFILRFRSQGEVDLVVDNLIKGIESRLKISKSSELLKDNVPFYEDVLKEVQKIKERATNKYRMNDFPLSSALFLNEYMKISEFSIGYYEFR